MEQMQKRKRKGFKSEFIPLGTVDEVLKGQLDLQRMSTQYECIIKNKHEQRLTFTKVQYCLE